MKMAVMADVGRVNMDAVKPASESPYQMFRVASYVKNIDKGISMVNAFHDMGYETTLNIMAVSRDRGPELDEALHQVNEECKADVLYLVDSFGAFFTSSTASAPSTRKTSTRNLPATKAS